MEVTAERVAYYNHLKSRTMLPYRHHRSTGCLCCAAPPELVVDMFLRRRTFESLVDSAEREHNLDDAVEAALRFVSSISHALPAA